MTTKTTTALGFILVTMVLTLLAGCDQATIAKSASSSTQSLTVTSSSTYVYYNLTTGATVSDPATQGWDIAFSSATQGILTNSGATATTLTSGGVGGVYYSGSTDFDSVTSYDTSLFSRSFSTDTSVYVSTAGQSGSTTSQQVLNIMTKLDYVSGSGTSSDPYVNDASASVYTGNAYYAYANQTISASGEVYILRKGTGTGYAKLQITSMSGNTTSRVRVIKYANF